MPETTYKLHLEFTEQILHYRLQKETIFTQESFRLEFLLIKIKHSSSIIRDIQRLPCKGLIKNIILLFCWSHQMQYVLTFFFGKTWRDLAG